MKIETFLKNKKAGEKYLSIFWFLVLVLILVAVVLSVLIYHNQKIDIRKIEAEILSNKLIKCLNPNGEFLLNAFDQNFDIFKECNLNREVFKKKYFYFNIYLENTKTKEIKEIIEGNHAFQKDCGISLKIIAEEYPKCSLRNNLFFASSKDEKIGIKAIILTGVNQEIRKL